MSTVQATSATAVQDLAKNLIKSFDANSDGQLGQDEFGSFLSQLMNGIQTASGTMTASSADGRHGTSDAFEGRAPPRPVRGLQLRPRAERGEVGQGRLRESRQRGGRVPATKTEAESWFNQNVKQGMESLGHKVDWVKGDKFQFSNWQGSWVVDFVRGADGPNPRFTWLADQAGASFT